MTDFLQLFFSGLATGSIYALAALGFTLLWQASGTINFAQGEFVMLPAFMMIGCLTAGMPLLVSFCVSCILSVVVLGWLFKNQQRVSRRTELLVFITPRVLAELTVP